MIINYVTVQVVVVMATKSPANTKHLYHKNTMKYSGKILYICISVKFKYIIRLTNGFQLVSVKAAHV